MDGGKGSDILSGGAGLDVFVFGDGDQIRDFKCGEDQISVAGAEGFGELEIFGKSGVAEVVAVVRWNGGMLTLQDFDHNLLDEDDFIF